MRTGARCLGAVLLALAACAGPRPAAAVPSRYGPSRSGPLRVGIAAFDQVDPLARVEQIAALGFDYVEPALSRLATASSAEVDAARQRLRAAGLRVETMNWFLPPDLKVTGPAVDAARVTAYLERALALADSFGVEVVVFGSPGARSYPDGFPRERAWQQLVAFLRQVAAILERRHSPIVIGIEALRRPESNIVNNVSEAAQLAQDVDRPQVKIIVDFYHLTFEQEDPAVVRAAAPWIVHLQIADPRARGFPCSAEGEPRYAQFFAALRDVGYRGRISIEAIATDFQADAAQALACLRALAAGR